MVPEKKSFKCFYHEQAFWPCDLDCLNKPFFPQPKEAPYDRVDGGGGGGGGGGRGCGSWGRWRGLRGKARCSNCCEH